MENPVEPLRQLPDATLPYFSELCGLRFRANTLLCSNNWCMDLAFLEGCYRYSHALGPTISKPGVQPLQPTPSQSRNIIYLRATADSADRLLVS